MTENKQTTLTSGGHVLVKDYLTRIVQNASTTPGKCYPLCGFCFHVRTFSVELSLSHHAHCRQKRTAPDLRKYVNAIQNAKTQRSRTQGFCKFVTWCFSSALISERHSTDPQEMKWIPTNLSWGAIRLSKGLVCFLHRFHCMTLSNRKTRRFGYWISCRTLDTRTTIILLQAPKMLRPDSGCFMQGWLGYLKR